VKNVTNVTKEEKKTKQIYVLRKKIIEVSLVVGVLLDLQDHRESLELVAEQD